MISFPIMVVILMWTLALLIMLLPKRKDDGHD
jgi:hypothetical protein